jgi:hypothetical protein
MDRTGQAIEAADTAILGRVDIAGNTVGDPKLDDEVDRDGATPRRLPGATVMAASVVKGTADE